MWMDGWTDGMMMVMPGINKDITVAVGDRQINRANNSIRMNLCGQTCLKREENKAKIVPVSG